MPTGYYWHHRTHHVSRRSYSPKFEGPLIKFGPSITRTRPTPATEMVLATTTRMILIQNKDIVEEFGNIDFYDRTCEIWVKAMGSFLMNAILKPDPGDVVVVMEMDLIF